MGFPKITWPSLLFVWAWSLSVCRSLAVTNVGVTEWLPSGSQLEFDARVVPHHLLLNRLNWVEKNERSTSKNYTLWEKADLYLLEWPGNVTLFDQDNPVVKWGRRRAKYIEDPCGAEHTGTEMRAYAFDYVYLTWGPYRLTKTYSPPLTVPKYILGFTTLAKLSRNNNFEPNKLNSIIAYDMAFTYDTLLLAYSCGIIRISGLEMNWAELSSNPTTPLNYALSKGISGFVNKIVTQDCCLKSEHCSFGNFVVAYREYSIPHLIYISYDGGESFKQLSPLESDYSRLHVVLSYPELNSVLLVHGIDSNVKVTQGVVQSGIIYYNERTTLMEFQTNGELQGRRFGLDMSFVLWDKCNVWYSPDLGSNATKALFYVNKDIVNSPHNKHRIVSDYCSFGKMSAFAYAPNGKFGILDSNNVFFLGVDSKDSFSQLIALKVDMTLLKPETVKAVYPYFDIMQQPKLLYPPKYLQLPERLNMGKSYERRLGMRLLPKNVYPSDFILSFYEENVKKMKVEEKLKFALKDCETSSLQVNNSITQRKKYYSMSASGIVNFTIGFKSRSNSLRQLKFEPRRSLKFFRIAMKPVSIDTVEVENPRYLIKYRITIRPSTSAATNKVFKINFYTKSSLRCLQQPRVPVYIKVVTSPANIVLPNVSDDDMSYAVFLKSVGSKGETKYFKKQNLGETLTKDFCPLSKKKKFTITNNK